MYQQFVYWIAETFRRAGSYWHMGISMSEAFLQADLPLPQMYLDGMIGHGSDWSGYDYLAESLRSTIPLMIRLGITTAEEVDVDTFAKRLRAETLSQGSLGAQNLLSRALCVLKKEKKSFVFFSRRSTLGNSRNEGKMGFIDHICLCSTCSFARKYLL